MGSGVLILAVLVLPWVQYRVGGTASVHSLGAGGLSAVLVTLAVANLALAAIRLKRPGRALSVIFIAVAASALVLTVVAAAGRIEHANALTIVAGGYTTYSVGSILAFLATVGMTAAGGFELRQRWQSAPAQTGNQATQH